MRPVEKKKKPTKHWTGDETKEFLSFVERTGADWEVVAAHFGRSKASCQSHFWRVAPYKLRRRFERKTVPDLTPEQVEAAHRIRKTGRVGRLDVEKIAKIMGVRIVQVQRIFCPQEIERKRYAPLLSAGIPVERPRNIPDWVIEERDRAFAAEIDAAAEMLGDPRPGRSALDRMSIHHSGA